MSPSDPIPEPQTIANVDCDEQAKMLLPPHRLARVTYASYRAGGDSPAAALAQTLSEWRELMQDARPFRHSVDGDGERNNHH